VSASSTPDGAALPRRLHLGRRTLLHALGLVLAGALTGLIVWGYRQPALVFDLSSLMLLC